MAVLALEASVETEEESWLREQLEALTDELWDRHYRPQQRLWLRADCPWCKRIKAARMSSDIPCPICTQLDRSQQDEGETIAAPFPIYEPDHRTTATLRITLDYAVAPTRREKGRQHGVGAERARWETELNMVSPIPTSQDTVAPFAVELANRFKRELRELPLRTMR